MRPLRPTTAMDGPVMDVRHGRPRTPPARARLRAPGPGHGERRGMIGVVDDEAILRVGRRGGVADWPVPAMTTRPGEPEAAADPVDEPAPPGAAAPDPASRASWLGAGVAGRLGRPERSSSRARRPWDRRRRTRSACRTGSATGPTTRRRGQRQLLRHDHRRIADVLDAIIQWFQLLISTAGVPLPYRRSGSSACSPIALVHHRARRRLADVDARPPSASRSSRCSASTRTAMDLLIVTLVSRRALRGRSGSRWRSGWPSSARPEP